MKGFLSLGSNLGDKKNNLEQALALLENKPMLENKSLIKIKRISGYYETEPWGGVEQDSFFNLVAEIESDMDPWELLKYCQEVEKVMGRERLIHWGPRIIDIDILSYNNRVLHTAELTIPHPFMEEREFVLAPLRELEPDYILPSGKSIQKVVGQGKVKKIL